jgi:serine protease Do
MTKHRKTRVLGIAAIAASAALIVATWASPSHAAAPEKEGFADLVEQVEPSVVTVEVTKTAAVQPSQFQGDPRAEEFMQRFFGGRGMRPSQQQPMQGAGSGFVIDVDGYIVTNNHVVEGADKVTVRLVNGRQYTAEIVGADDKTDLALLKIDADDLEAATFGDSDDTRVGDWVVAIGNPFGLGGTATAGIVSARSRDIRSGPYDDYLQIDAPINRGNSGGPVFNTDGEVVGVNTAIFSPNGGSVGIGFAIPSNQVDDIIAELRSDGVVDRGWLGVSLQDIDQDLADSLGLESQDGTLVTQVAGDSPAERAGIEVGDVIVSFDGGPVSNAKDLAKLVGSADSGDKAKLGVRRDDKNVKLTAVLGTPDNSVAAARSEKDLDDLGLAIAPLTDELRDQLGVDEDLEGAVVMRVAPGSKAAAQGIRRGDIVVQADRKPVTSASDLKNALAQAKNAGRDSVPVLVRRGDFQRFAVLPVA